MTTTEPNNDTSVDNPVGRFMVASGAVIELNTTGKILIVQRSRNLDWQPSEWEICYGRLDQFEDVETGLHREIFEELGIQEFEIIKPLRVWHIFRGSQKADNELIGITYHCRTKTQEIHISQEHMQYQWVNPQKALEMIQVSGIREDIQMYIKFSQVL
jgi:8-oxo-dGTP pyrophosphatase MutT (NUDIX family)